MISGIKRYCQNMAILNINEVHLLNKDKKNESLMAWVGCHFLGLIECYNVT